MIGYWDITVLEAAKLRISKVFDEFDNIYVSVSSGKDSTVLFNLCLEEAAKRNRKVKLFFLDQEAEYEGTVTIMREMMINPLVEPYWYQVPVRMTNATSYDEPFLYAWGPGEEWYDKKKTLQSRN